MLQELEPRTGLCDDSAEPAWDSLSPSISAGPLLAHLLSLSLSQNKLKKKIVHYPKKNKFQGAWVVQLVKHLTLGFSSGHDLKVCGIEPQVGLQR